MNKRRHRHIDKKKIYKDTWNLDNAWFEWLYPRLKTYLKFGGQIVNLEFYKFDIDGEELTQLQCIERMIKDLELLRANDYDFWHVDAAKAAEDVAKIWSKVVLAMWW